MKSNRLIALWLLAIGGLGMSSQLLAQRFARDFDEQEWVEQQAKLPEFPKAENLLVAGLMVRGRFDFWSMAAR